MLTTYEFVTALRKFRDVLSEKSSGVRTLTILGMYGVGQGRKLLKEVPASEVLPGIEELRGSLSLLRQRLLLSPSVFGDRPPNVLERLADRLADIAVLFQRMDGSRPIGDRALGRLLNACHEASVILSSIRDFIDITERSLYWQGHPEPKRGIQTILFGREVGYDDMITRLKALGRIYATLSYHLDVDARIHPIHIRSVEGNRVEVQGAPKVMSLLKDLVKAALAYSLDGHDRPDRPEVSGRKTVRAESRDARARMSPRSLPHRAAAARDLFRLGPRLERAGAREIKEMERLDQFALLLSREIGRLIRGQNLVTVDGATFGGPSGGRSR